MRKLRYSFFLIILLLQSVLSAQAQKNGTVWGIDLSHHQGQIDWKLLAAQKPSFIFFKATEGSTHLDKTYKGNRQQAARFKIPSGAYHFFSYTSSGLRQALHFIKVARLKRGDLPPVLDIEWTKPMPARSAVAREVNNFVQTIEREMGVKPIIYCTCMLYNQYLKNRLTGGSYQLWVASYSGAPDCDYLFWQKSSNHRLKGIDGNVDYNIFMGNAKALQKLLLK